ncbi:amidohydrolase [Psychrobacter sp. FDAARGOS_221]|uniref:amidohydrolase n=1 Tax=Psychrobacter sp. FDAARGOS_221 TaxID=1975705 RepID=UPI000BB58672|nr:amidohydrolase [Psychrobacter sp. FDAARGOS_221]PNK60848.1 amidohydrolase [Psychrobacter sp. FDAARGOS_221]
MIKNFLMLAGSVSVLTACAVQNPPSSVSTPKNLVADMIVTNAKVAVMDDKRTVAEAIAVKNGKVLRTGSNEDILNLQGKMTRVIDANGRTIIPGLNDSHLHITRGGRFYNTELRWDGVTSLKEALRMLKEQADRTPEGQWVRVIGGWSPYQFEEKRMPTVEEINEATGDTPAFVLYLYSRGWLNQAGLEALGIDENTPPPNDDSRYEKDENGKLTGVLLAEPNAMILYQVIGKLPALSEEDMINSTKHFYHELNRFGLTSAIDAGGGGHHFPENYEASKALATSGDLSMRISYYLFPQEAGKEISAFEQWMANNTASVNEDPSLEHGYELKGGGEYMTWAAGDFENFLADKPSIEDNEGWREDTKKVIQMHVDEGWPFRQHSTYGQNTKLIVDLVDEIDRENNGKIRNEMRWAIDHAETVTDETLREIKRLNGGISVQDRMAYAGEYFVERYGAEAAKTSPPFKKIFDMGIPLGSGTDGTRVASYNPWISLYWMTTGKTVGGTQLYDKDNILSREDALEVYTSGSAWFSSEENVKGTLEPGKYADFVLLSDDYFTVPEEKIKTIESVLTVLGGDVVYGAGEYSKLDPQLPPISPSWSPVKYYGGYHNPEKPAAR